ncbi:tryptophan synthase subunit alpha [candidate division KSB1 bacterium]|nr:tryptophan synthase subunit alpha [candidate division KSB1 bacterium]RQW00903.1 MAG: tryptophan synthase subunit alpha [candidate division KSB1 bacterium]
MNRLEKHLREVKLRDEKAAIFFITAGDPSLKETFNIMLHLAENGADCIELGMPFSDPIADGPVIQRSTLRALKQNVRLEDILKLVQQFRKKSPAPVVVMGYYNPIIRYGVDRFIQDCVSSGIDGLIIADLPYEEGEDIEKICKENNTSLIYLLAPDIDPKRTRAIVRASSGFIYCVAHYSTTGTHKQNDDKVLPQTIKSLQDMTDLSVALGFGISSLEKAKELSRLADGIIIGSWLIQELESATDKAECAANFVNNVKAAINNHRGKLFSVKREC